MKCSTLLYCSEVVLLYCTAMKLTIQTQCYNHKMHHKTHKGDNSKKQQSSKATGTCQNVIITSRLAHKRARDNCGGNGAPNFACPCGSLVRSSPHFKRQLLLPCGPFLIPTADCIMYSKSQRPPPPPPTPFLLCTSGNVSVNSHYKAML